MYNEIEMRAWKKGGRLGAELREKKSRMSSDFGGETREKGYFEYLQADGRLI